MHNSLMNILQEIFTDYYEEIKYTLHPRPAEMRNIDKMIRYGGLYARHREKINGFIGLFPCKKGDS